MAREQTPSREYVEYICNLYGDVYDDRLEDCRPPAAGDELRNPGEDWKPGQVAEHKSLAAFQKELEVQGIKLSSSIVIALYDALVVKYMRLPGQCQKQ